MIPVAQLDPASLALWVNFEFLQRSPNFRYYEPVINAAARGDLSSVAEAIKNIPARRTMTRALHLASIVWHEQRHFLDLTITNYGARLFRDNFTVAMNAGALIADQRTAGATELLLPLERYRTLPRSLRPAAVAPSVLAQADDIRKRRAIRRQDSMQFLTAMGPMQINGESVLEALGFLGQHWSVFRAADSKSALDVLQDIPARLQRNLMYEWPVQVAHWLRMAPPDVLASYPLLPGARLLAALMLGALCGPWLDTSESQAMVTTRFAHLVAALAGGQAADLYTSTFADCWSAVSALCKSQWGRTPVEEIEADIEHEERLATLMRDRKQSLGQDPAADFFLRYHANRRLALEEIRASPMLLDPTAGPEPNALPVPVFAVPRGQMSELPDSHVGLIRVRVPTIPASDGPMLTWAFFPRSWPPDGTLIGFEPDDSWRETLRFSVPAAKLMLNGLRHRTMLGPELRTAHDNISRAIDVRIDPAWAYSPAEETAIDQCLFLAEVERLPCDVCDRRVGADEARLISPTELRSDPDSVRAAGQVFAAKLTGTPAPEREEAGILVAGELDWSHWLVCGICADRLRPQRQGTQAEAAELKERAAGLSASQRTAVAGLLVRALAAQREGKHDDAIDCYQQAIDTGDPRVVPTAAYAVGMMHAARGDLQRAEAAYRTAIDPRWPYPSEVAAFNLGHLLEERGDLAEAAWAYGRAVGGDDDQVRSRAYLRRGLCLLRLRELGHAFECLTSAITAGADPADVQQAWSSIGLLHANANRRPEAVAAWAKATEGPSDELATTAAATAISYAVQWRDDEVGERFSEILDARGGAAGFAMLMAMQQAMIEQALERDRGDPGSG